MQIFFIIMISLYALLNFYLISRGWKFVESVFPFVSKTVYLICSIFLCLLYVFSMFFFRNYYSPLSRMVESVGSSWMVILFYGVLFLLGIDILRLAAFFIKPLNLFIVEHGRILTLTLGFIFIGFLVMVFAIGTRNATEPRTTKYAVEISKKPDELQKLKIVFISDVHLGIAIGRDRLKEIIDGIISLNPDLVLFVGDIIEGDNTAFETEKMGEEIQRLKPKYGMYGVPGNHDYFGKDPQATIDSLRKSGIRMLLDEKVLISDSFYIIGRNDRGISRRNGMNRLPLTELVKDVDFKKPVILMDHQPFDLFDAERNGIDLQVSGHTHHGQFWPNSLITNKVYEKDWGYLRKGNTQYIVSCGVGTWGPQIRIGSFSEIVEINVQMTGNS